MSISNPILTLPKESKKQYNEADEVVSPKDGDPVKRVIEMTDNLGADTIIDFVNASKTVETDMQMLRRRARLILVGLFGGELKLALVGIAYQSIQVNWIICWEFK